MASGRAVLRTAMLLWLVSLLSASTVAHADIPPTITISPTDPPTSNAVDIRLYAFFDTGVGWHLIRDDVVGNMIEIEHFFDVTNLPTTTEFDETYFHDFLGGNYTLRWTMHFEYAGQVVDRVLEVPFSVPLTEPIIVPVEPVPAVDAWALGLAAALLGLLLVAGARTSVRIPGKNVT